MTSSTPAPKQWILTKYETVTSFEAWKGNLIYRLSLDKNFAPFLECSWEKWSKANPYRGFTDDTTGRAAFRKTAAQKAAALDLLLGQVANYCPVIARNTIVRNSTSLQQVWQTIRAHYGFQSSGAQILDLSSFKLENDERYEDLFQRLCAFVEDNMTSSDSNVLHHGNAVDEELTPIVENITVVIWLKLIHPELPALVKQRYGTELRNKTLASLKPEISQAIDCMMEEIKSSEEGRAMRTFTPNRKFCVLCKAEKRPYSSHYLWDCKFVPDIDKRQHRKQASGRFRRVDQHLDEYDEEEVVRDNVGDDDADEDNATADEVNRFIDTPTTTRRVGTIQSPSFNAFYKSKPVPITLDTGATTNMIRHDFAKSIGLPIIKAHQQAHQADGITPLSVRGEVHCKLSRDHYTFTLDALVVDQLDCEVLSGTVFMNDNDIGTRPAKKQIIIRGSDVLYYGSYKKSSPKARRMQSYVLRGPPHHTVLLPGEQLALDVPDDAPDNKEWALEPRLDSHMNRKRKTVWPCHQEITSDDGIIKVCNDTDEPILVRKNEHVCQIRTIINTDEIVSSDCAQSSPVSTFHKPQTLRPYSDDIPIDPENKLSSNMMAAFKNVNHIYDDVFNPSISKYNGASGPLQAVVNIGPALPPQRKGRLPHYNRDKLLELQQKFDDLENAGVFAKPEDVGVNVEYLNLSFLVQKPSGGTRLVTSFGEVANYCKPQPSLMPSVDSVLRDIASWKFLIVTDLLQSFYQIPLAKSSMKYCGVCTPFKGVRVYTRSAMGMPGSETALEEMMSRVVGQLVQEGRVCKLADDLYVGGHTAEELLDNWSCLLKALHDNGLRLSAKKTKICPQTCTILGWIWSQGTLSASSHRIATLSAASPPATVSGLRSFIGAYKVLSRVLPNHAAVLHPLDLAVAGGESKNKIIWTEELTNAFEKAKRHLERNKTIHLPRRDDVLWLVTDGSVKNCGLGATLYVLRQNKLHLAGFFSAKLRRHQINWLPCEIEALCIGASVQHFAPYIIQSNNCPQVLTDSKPCVQAFQKLQRGEFSTSSRVTTFLSILSRYQAQLQHISGAANLPSDFASRNPPSCENSACQICKFITEIEDSTVRSLSVRDVLDGRLRMPFTERASWNVTQQESKDLRRTHAHLTQGTRPSKKATLVKDVKRYLQVASIARDGLLVVQDLSPFSQKRERIIVPKSVLNGLLTALHLQFQHPSKYQLKQVFSRYFFALNSDKAIENTTSSCHHCMAVKSLPHQFQEQSTSAPPIHIGTTFAADVMRRYKQFVFVLRETFSLYTTCMFIPDETHKTLRNALIELSSRFTVPKVSLIHVRVDPAPGFFALRDDEVLKKHGITLDIGDAKNINKNPVAEHAIKELQQELLNSSESGPVSTVSLSIAVSLLNARIRSSGLSSNEIWTCRDQISKEKITFKDSDLIQSQYERRTSNHLPSAKSKSRGRKPSPDTSVKVGDLVYLICDGDKNQSRARYIVVSLDDPWCHVRKFTQTQFRSRVYRVRMSECIKIPKIPHEQSDNDVEKVKGMEIEEDDKENKDEDNEEEEEEVEACNVRPSSSINTPMTCPPVLTDVLNTSVPAKRQSGRITKRPTWMSTDWDLTRH